MNQNLSLPPQQLVPCLTYSPRGFMNSCLLRDSRAQQKYISFSKSQLKYGLCSFLVLASGKSFYFLEFQSSPLQNETDPNACLAWWMRRVAKYAFYLLQSMICSSMHIWGGVRYLFQMYFTMLVIVQDGGDTTMKIFGACCSGVCILVWENEQRQQINTNTYIFFLRDQPRQ